VNRDIDAPVNQGVFEFFRKYTFASDHCERI
jgi:hypothetical protein